MGLTQINFKVHIIVKVLKTKIHLKQLITQCIESKDIVKRVELLQHLNRLLSREYKIEIPSFITNSLIDKKLYLLQENIG